MRIVLNVVEILMLISILGMCYHVFIKPFKESIKKNKSIKLQREKTFDKAKLTHKFSQVMQKYSYNDMKSIFGKDGRRMRIFVDTGLF
jgi:hypothetical protein